MSALNAAILSQLQQMGKGGEPPVDVGGTVWLADYLPIDIEYRGARYLRSGFRETDAAKLPDAIWPQAEAFEGHTDLLAQITTSDTYFVPTAILWDGVHGVIAGTINTHGAVTSGNPRILTTHNGGQTWSEQTPGTPVSSQPIRCGVVVDGVFLLGTNQSYILRSTDNGDTWTVIEPPIRNTGLSMIDMQVNAAGTILVYGGEANITNYIWQSVDGGVTWTARSAAGRQSSIGRFVYLTASARWLFVIRDRNLLYSDNDGVTWSASPAATGTATFQDIVPLGGEAIGLLTTGQFRRAKSTLTEFNTHLTTRSLSLEFAVDQQIVSVIGSSSLGAVLEHGGRIYYTGSGTLAAFPLTGVEHFYNTEAAIDHSLFANPGEHFVALASDGTYIWAATKQGLLYRSKGVTKLAGVPYATEDPGTGLRSQSVQYLRVS